MGSGVLNGCHAEAERRWRTPALAGLFVRDTKAVGGAPGPSESPGLLVFAVTRGQGRGSLLTPGSFMLHRPIGDGSQSRGGGVSERGLSLHSQLPWQRFV